MRVERARDDESPFILAVGTVEPRKNLEVLIAALPALPGLRLVSAGPPTPYLDRCVALARDAGVADRVKFRGYVPRAEILDLYARALACAVPSRYEGFGYGAAQALCAGVPLVCSNASSLPEVAGPETSYVAPDDVAGWSAAIAAVAVDAAGAEERAAALRGEACARFAWSASARAATDAYALAMLRV